MKKTIILAAIISAFGVTATYAQDAPAAPAKEKKEAKDDSRGRRGGERMGMYANLNLTQEQKDKIKAIDDEQRKEFQALRGDASLTEDAKREKRMALMKTRKEKVDAILTADQKAKLEANMKERRERGPKKEDKQ